MKTAIDDRLAPPAANAPDGRTADARRDPSPLAGLQALAARIAEGAAARERERRLPFEAFGWIRRSGLGALRIPRALGGLGGSIENLVELIATLAAADSNVGHALRSHFNATELWSLTPLTPHSALQIRRVLDGALYGGALTELGTERTSTVTTQLARDGEHYRISGKKYYATGTAYADYASIAVLDEAGNPVTIVLPVDRPGVRILDDWDGMGQRLTASGGLELENVEVRADEIAPRPVGTQTLQTRHASALRQLILVATAAGIVRNLFADAQAHVRERGRPAAHSPAATARDDPFIQLVIGELSARTHAVDALVAENARVLDRSAAAIAEGAPEAEERVLDGALATAKTQLVVGKLALEAAERMFEAGGASATSRALNLDRHWRNLRTIFSHNPLLHKARVLGDYHLNGTTTHLEEARVF
ncbi:acyl-CoA dehydrogenase [Burkholderia sp. WAC0059]|uniref:acyl-CoA dehydrogenase family protein n=1 Tax=Burkholderia sp. WAC0059 TaxID=2066022 RepID=UPI000C7F6B98|nr:acyl-CoA dehydrogenase family protein [Burkholderia sp. WAC0059]PLZ03871.1 acyl-CoA dehydrogenase [Burkholderia sp. WAC0059]